MTTAVRGVTRFLVSLGGGELRKRPTPRQLAKPPPAAKSALDMSSGTIFGNMRRNEQNRTRRDDSLQEQLRVSATTYTDNLVPNNKFCTSSDQEYLITLINIFGLSFPETNLVTMGSPIKKAQAIFGHCSFGWFGGLF